VSEHEPNRGASDDWYTPPHIFDALGLIFDLDVASPGPDHWVPARQVFTQADDGLAQPWQGLVWMNPPFGGRNGQVPWLRKFIAHGNGIGLVAARTSAGWFHDWMPQMHALLFPKGKTQFIRPDGSVGTSPGTGVVLFAMGQTACDALMRSGLGMALPLRPHLSPGDAPYPHSIPSAEAPINPRSLDRTNIPPQHRVARAPLPPTHWTAAPLLWTWRP
jgi:hypothetical protein